MLLLMLVLVVREGLCAILLQQLLALASDVHTLLHRLHLLFRRIMTLNWRWGLERWLSLSLRYCIWWILAILWWTNTQARWCKFTSLRSSPSDRRLRWRWTLLLVRYCSIRIPHWLRFNVVVFEGLIEALMVLTDHYLSLRFKQLHETRELQYWKFNNSMVLEEANIINASYEQPVVLVQLDGSGGLGSTTIRSFGRWLFISVAQDLDLWILGRLASNEVACLTVEHDLNLFDLLFIMPYPIKVGQSDSWHYHLINRVLYLCLIEAYWTECPMSLRVLLDTLVELKCKLLQV